MLLRQTDDAWGIHVVGLGKRPSGSQLFEREAAGQ